VISAHHTKEDLDAMVKQLNIFSNLSTSVDGDIRFVL
jgi:8-amino-7-oxononanoate synthase